MLNTWTRLSSCSFAIILHSQWCNQDVQILFEQVLQVIGSEHRQTLSTMRSLALVHNSKSRIEVSSNHPGWHDLATTVTLRAQGRFYLWLCNLRRLFSTKPSKNLRGVLVMLRDYAYMCICAVIMDSKRTWSTTSIGSIRRWSAEGKAAKVREIARIMGRGGEQGQLQGAQVHFILRINFAVALIPGSF